MHPLVPYLLGEKHPAGDKIFDVQRCIRTGDIDEVGDDSHLTCFEMLGNWFLGTCPKEEMIALSYEFLTGKDYLNIPVERLATSVFAGDEVAPRDEVAQKAWLDAGMKRVFFLPKENNWWALGGGVGPCGPDTEMFYDTGKPATAENILKFGTTFLCNIKLKMLAKKLLNLTDQTLTLEWVWKELSLFLMAQKACMIVAA